MCSRAILTLTLLFSFAAYAHAQVWERCNVLYQITGENGADSFGWVGRRAGLVDADGAQDIVVGAPGFAAGAGKAYVYSGSTGTLLFAFTGGAGEGVGTSVDTAGDLNGDGASEVLIGAPGNAGIAGRVYVLDGQTGNVMRTLSAGVAGDAFGASVGSVGDVDGDLVPDILVGATLDDSAALNAGRVYLYSGAAGALLREVPGEASGDRLGSAVGSIGDRNADQRGDYVICAQNGGPGDRGKAWVYDGATGSLVGAPLLPTVSGLVYGQFFAGLVGDVNGDGTPDFFVSDWRDSTNGATTGKAYVYSGADLALLLAPTGDTPGVGYGIGRGYAGDVDGDGLDDLFLAAFLANDGAVDAGKGIVHAAASGEPFIAYHGDVLVAALGFDADGLGDVDGDGVPDFLLTAVPGNGTRGYVVVLSGAPLPPNNFCEAALNSAGTSATITYRRSLSIADNLLRLRVDGAPPDAIGLFFYGDQPQQTPFGDGWRCITGQTFRLGPALRASSTGTRVRPIDFSQGPPSSGAGQITAGSTWYFQFLYRDLAGPGGSGFNLSDGLEITFCP